MFWVRCTKGSLSGSRFEVNRDLVVGRDSKSSIQCLDSSVSKTHGVIRLRGDRVEVEDLGSSNGTFLNNQKVKKSFVSPGDRIRFGDVQFVFELLVPQSVDAFNSIEPKSTFESKPIQFFEEKIMPIFYGLNFKKELKSIGLFLALCFIGISIFGSISPVTGSFKSAMGREIGELSKNLAISIANQNENALLKSKTAQVLTLGIEKWDGVVGVWILDLDGRILFPSEDAGEILTEGEEANVFANESRRALEGKIDPVYRLRGNRSIGIAPLLKSNGSESNEAFGIVLVSFDLKNKGIGEGTILIHYAQTIALLLVVCFLLSWIWHRLSHKPFEILNSELDAILRGDLKRVTHEFKNSELNTLFENINALASRDQSGTSEKTTLADEIPSVFEVFSEANFGVCFLKSSEIQYVNRKFEEITGFRGADSIGKKLWDIARDQAFVSLAKELVSGFGVQNENFEFSGNEVSIKSIGFDGGGTLILFERTG